MKPRGFWSKEEVLKVVSLCDNRSEFSKKYYQAYVHSKNNNYLDDLYPKRSIKRDRIWNSVNIKEVALQYNNRTDFRLAYPGAYTKAVKLNILDEICSHMQIVGHKYLRDIYAFEFEDNFVYVGLSYNINKRKYNHLSDNSSAVFKHINKTQSSFVFKKLTNELVSCEAAQKLERFFEKQYIENGWNILNRCKTGGLGGNQNKWNFESVTIEALKYKNKTEFRKNSNVAYQKAVRNKWLPLIYI